MSAQTVIERLAIGLASLLAILVLGYAAFAPMLSSFNGKRFNRQVSKPNPAEEKRWAQYKRSLDDNPGKPGILPEAATEVKAKRWGGALMARLRARNERILREREGRQ